MLEMLTPGVGSVIGAIGQMAGGMMSNASNAKQAEANRAFQERMVGVQNDFQREMVNTQQGNYQNNMKEARDWDSYFQGTAYQRATNDMRAAGINPMLAYMKGGAGPPTTGGPSMGAAPSGGSASGAQARMENVASGLAHSASEAARVGPQVKLLQQQAEQGHAQTGLLQEQQALARAEVKQTEANTALTILKHATEGVQPSVSRALIGHYGGTVTANEAAAVASGAAAGASTARAAVDNQTVDLNARIGRPGQIGATQASRAGTFIGETGGAALTASVPAIGGMGVIARDALVRLRELFREGDRRLQSTAPDARHR